MATPLRFLSPFPPFEPQATGPPKPRYDPSDGVLSFPRIGGRFLRGIQCELEDHQSGLAATIAAVAYEHYPNCTRQRAGNALEKHVPARPVYKERLPRLRRRGISDQEIRQAAGEALQVAPWDERLLEESGPDGYEICLDRLPAYLSREIMDRLIGPGSRTLESSERAIGLDALPPEEAQIVLAEVKGRRGARTAEEQLTRHFAEQLVEQAQLSKAEHQVWHLYYRRRFTPKEIAEDTGRAPGTVRSLLHRARQKLQSALPESLQDAV